MSTLIQDLRFALRLFRRAPGTSALAVVSLALGIGANAGIFSVVDALGFRPLAVLDEASLVRVFGAGQRDRLARVSYPEFQELRKQATLFSGMMARGLRGAGIVTESGEREIVLTDVVSGDYFSTLGIAPALGRPFQARDEFAGAAPVVAISDRLWHRRFGGDPSVVGKPIRVNDTLCELVAVMKPDFRGTQGMASAELWVPFETWALFARGNRRDFTEANDQWLDVTGRLKAGVTLERAQAEAGTIAGRLAQQLPDSNRHRTFVLQFERAARQGNLVRLAALLFAVVGLVLLIACANVAGLLLGRSEDRRHEIGVRLAVGASRGRLVRQMLVESVALSLVSGVAGWMLAWWVVRLLPAMLPPGPLAMGVAFQLDSRILAFTALLTLVTGPAFGLLPAWRGSRVSVLRALRGDGSTSRLRQFGLRDGLVVLQVAVCAVLLVGAGLTVRTLAYSQMTDTGFTLRKGLVVQVVAPRVSSREEELVFYRTLVERASALPDVTGATIANRLHMAASGGGAADRVVVAGQPLPPGQDAPKVRYTIVDEHYFPTLGTRIVAGRAFTATDVPGPKLVIVSEEMARKYWPDGGAVGARIQVGDTPSARVEYQVVGVAQDGKYNDVTEDPQPHMYYLWGQRLSGDVTLITAVGDHERAVADALRGVIRELAPGAPTMKMLTIEEHLRFALYEPRVVAILVSTLGGIGLLLAMTGLYGVVMRLVAQRSREIGIRMALGAAPRDVLAGVLRRSMASVGIGLVLGLAGAVALGGTMRGILFGVTPLDPVTYAAVVGLVGVVALLASLAPARRAAQVDPVKTLKAE